jgi:hypothetical protein
MIKKMRKKIRMSKDIGKLLTPDEMEDALKEQMGEEYYSEFKKEMTSLENDVIGKYMNNKVAQNEDHPKLKLYKKSVSFGFELFVLGIGAKVGSSIYKTFQEYNKGVDQILKTIIGNAINKEKPSPKELAFIFGVRITLSTQILEKFKNDPDWESKTWKDITQDDIQGAVKKILKEYNQVVGIEGINANITRH